MVFPWYALSLSSALFSAFAAIIQKKVLFRQTALGFSTLLSIFNLILAIPFFFLIDFSSLPLSGIFVLFFKSVLAAGAFYCVMAGIKNLELSRALPLLVLTPGLVAFFAFIFLQEPLTKIEIIGIFLLIIGTYTLSLKPKQKLKTPFKEIIKPKGFYFIITALALFTISSILDKALLKNFNLPLNAFMGFQHLFFAFIFLIIILCLTKTKEVQKAFKKSWKFILIIAFFTIIYRYTHLQAISMAPVALALSIKRISVFIAVVLGGTLFKEHNLFRKIFATITMTIGAILIITN